MTKQIRHAFIILMIAAFAAHSFAQEEADKPSDDKKISLQKIPSSLEEMLTGALDSNPDILVAEADLNHAQAKVNQVRLNVSHALVHAFQQRMIHQNSLKNAKSRYERLKALMETGQADSFSVDDQRQTVLAEEGAVAETEAIIREIIGMNPSSGETPESLEEMLTVALESNGEIVLARADLVRMDARLNQVRLRVTEDVTIAYQMRRTRRAALDTSKSILNRIEEKLNQGIVSQEEMLPAFQAVIEAEADLVRIEARIRYLMGLGGA